MESFFIAVVSMAVVLGIMILVHEFGHFAAAKWFGVRVDVFSIGFGKRLAGFRRGETDYRISALPLGGYVKMAGENPLESRSGAPEEFMSHPRWQRFVIAIAGPAMNIVLAVALLTGVFMVHYERPSVLRSAGGRGLGVGRLTGRQGRHRAGRPHCAYRWRTESDLGRRNPESDDQSQAAGRCRHPARKRHSGEAGSSPSPKALDEYGSVGWQPDQAVTVTELVPNMPAAKAGLKLQ